MGVRITAGGVISFVWRYVTTGHEHRYPIGQHPKPGSKAVFLTLANPGLPWLALAHPGGRAGEIFPAPRGRCQA